MPTIDVDHDQRDVGPPLKVGGVATASPPVAVGEGDRVNASYNLAGSARVAVTEGNITVGSIAAVVSVALDGTGGTPDTVGVVDSAGDRMGINPDGSVPVATGLLKPIGAYDYVELVYTGANLTTVRYRAGGVAGSIVATLTLSYTGANLTGVART